MKAVSDKRRAERNLRQDTVAHVRKRDGGCVCRGVLVGNLRCGGPIDVHEVLRRSQGGNYLDPDHCISLCRVHHDHATTGPVKELRSLGLIIQQKDIPPGDPATIDSRRMQALLVARGKRLAAGFRQ